MSVYHIQLWLDDERPAPPGWYWCKTVAEALTILSTFEVHAISLDHDLGTDPDDGETVMNWLEEHWQGDWYNVFIHTQNPVAWKRMNQVIYKKLGL